MTPPNPLTYCWRLVDVDGVCQTCGRRTVVTRRPNGVTWTEHEGKPMSVRLAELNEQRRKDRTQ